MKNIFNFQHAMIGFINTGILIFIINLKFGTLIQAIISGVVQGLITFSIVGINTAIFENLYERTKIYFLCVIVPSLFTSTLSYFIHFYTQSPTPIGSAIAIFIFAYINFSVLYILKLRFKTIRPTDLFNLLSKKVKSVYNKK